MPHLAVDPELSPLDSFLLSEMANGSKSNDRLANWFQSEGEPGETVVDALVRTGILIPEARRIAWTCRNCYLDLPDIRALFSKAGMEWLAEYSLDPSDSFHASANDRNAEHTTVPGVYLSAEMTDWFEAGRQVSAPPLTVGSYQLRELLGRSPNGTVHSAVNVFGGERFAVKLLPTAGPDGASVADRFFNGAVVVQQLGSPVCHPVYAARDFDHAFLVSREVSGGSIRDRMADNPPVPAEAAYLCAQAARALADIHDAGYAHGNVKAGNLLLGPEGVLLSDFALPDAAVVPRSLVTLTLQRTDVAALVRIYSDLLAKTKTFVPGPFRNLVRRDYTNAAELAEVLEQANNTLTDRSTARLETSLSLMDDEDEWTGHIPEVGDLLGKCRLTKQIGKGATGVVFRAEHQTLGIDVAVKVLSSVGRNPSQVAKEFSAEARMLARLNHPNVVRIWDFEAGAKFPPFLVLELIDGQTLNDMIQTRGFLQPHEAIPLFAQVTAGLAAAQRQVGLIHRDIKPANILLGSNGEVKVADLGLASMLDTEDKGPMPRIGGTFAYMAPEQAGGFQAADHRSDIYSLGVTLYHAVTGQLPFTGKSWMEVMLKHATATPIPPHDQVPTVPQSLSALITKMMAKKPSDRHQTYDELAAALEVCRADIQCSISQKKSSMWRLFSR